MVLPVRDGGMDIGQILKALGLVMAIVVLFIAAISVFLRLVKDERMDPSFKQIIKYLLISVLVSDMMGLLNLLLSAASGGWPLGFISCELWGFVSTTMLACSAWMVTTAVAERYLAILSPAEVSSTFSQRNTRIITVGMLLLLLMAATGPFYGFGEYTYLRGYLKVFVSTNISLPLSLKQKGHIDAVQLENLHQLFSHLKRSSSESPNTDMLSMIALHLHKHYDLIVNTKKWLPHGIIFYIRTLSSHSLDSFIEHYRDKVFAKDLTELSFIEDIAKTLNISDTELTVKVSMPEYYTYKQIHLPIQDMGICSADLTTPNHHASIWTGFYVCILFILPYCTSLAGLCSIYIRGFGYNSFASKRASDLDVSYTNITSTICMFTCLLNLIYFVIVLSIGSSVIFNVNVVFWVTLIVSLKTLVLVFTMSIGPNTCYCYCTCCHDCIKTIFSWNNADELSYELNDLELTQSLTGKRKSSNVHT